MHVLILIAVGIAFGHNFPLPLTLTYFASVYLVYRWDHPRTKTTVEQEIPTHEAILETTALTLYAKSLGKFTHSIARIISDQQKTPGDTILSNHVFNLAKTTNRDFREPLKTLYGLLAEKEHEPLIEFTFKRMYKIASLNGLSPEQTVSSLTAAANHLNISQTTINSWIVDFTN